MTVRWPSGYYLARLEPESTSSAQFDNTGEYILFASGAVYYQARYEDNGDALTCYKLIDFASQHDPLWNVDNSKVTTRFAWPPVDRPEAAVIGLSYNYGGMYPIPR